MGDAVVTSLVTDVVRRLTSSIFQELKLLWRVEDDVSALRDDFNRIQYDIDNLEQINTKEGVLESKLRKLKSASLMMENVLDEVSTEAMLRRLPKELGIKYKVKAFFSSNHNQLMFRFRIAHKVKSIRTKLGSIEAKSSELNRTPRSINRVDVGTGTGMPNRETSSLVHSSIIFGRNEEMEKVLKKICNKDIVVKHNDDNIPVYAIWGMGGLGKTTLAQLVYNHENVDKHFELKCWRYVSEKFQVKELIKGIIESIDKSDCRLSHLDDMQRSLQGKLRGKRFFIVLDDIWIEDEEKSEWDKLGNALSCGAEGSIVLVTTRNKSTSRMMAKVPELQHELGCLSKEDSWLLFEKLAFAEGRAGGDIRDFEPIGKEIVEKCKGLPLAIKTLGGLMWSKSSRSDWEHVKSSSIWELQHNNILPALKLSYDNLFPHIKKCFSYCCLFPKGYEMEKDLLISLWMGNGFIPRRGEASLYVLGEDIYNCLVWRSFFQVVDGKYKMHDLMHDLAKYVTGDDYLVIEPSKKSINREEVLHLSLYCSDFVFSDENLEKLRSLRSVIIILSIDYERSIRRIFKHVYLRVLYMEGVSLSTLPESVSKLRYLKYLNLSYSWIKEVPKSIIYLQNLQVLILEMCRYLLKFPKGMRYMRNVQHLNIKGCDSLEYLPAGIIKGVKDVRLTQFRIGKKKGATIGELGDIIHLEDELAITGLQNVEGGLSVAKNANLKSKSNLLVLNLFWTGISEPERNSGEEEEVLEGLEPNPSLKELQICYFMGKNLSPSWIVNLKNLVRIRFYSCGKCENIPPLGKLPFLMFIGLSEMNSLKCFNEEDNTITPTTLFPSLQGLLIKSCENLISLPSYFPKLNRFHIEDCRSMVSLPDGIQSFKDLNELRIFKCENLRKRYDKEIGGVDWPKISHIRNTIITSW